MFTRTRNPDHTVSTTVSLAKVFTLCEEEYGPDQHLTIVLDPEAYTLAERYPTWTMILALFLDQQLPTSVIRVRITDPTGKLSLFEHHRDPLGWPCYDLHEPKTHESIDD